MLLDLHDTVYNFLYKVCLRIIGLGAHQSNKNKRLLFLVFLIVTLSYVMSLVGGLTNDSTSNTITTIITIMTSVYVVSASFMGSMMYFQHNVIKEVYKKIASDWEKLINETEKKIVYTCTRQGLIVSCAVFLYGMSCYLFVGGTILIPTLINHTNRTEYSYIIPYYFSRMVIDDEMHCYQMSFHNVIGLVYTGLFYFGFMSNYVISVKHVCGIYMIVWYRRKLKKVNEPDEIELIDPQFIQKSIIQNLINVVVKHREAIEGLKLVEQAFSTSFLIFEVMALVIIAIAIILVSILGENHNKTANENVFIYSIAILYFIFLLILHYTGEQLIQVSTNIRSTACSICWYKLPIKAQKMLQMILIRSSRVDVLTGGSIVVLSLECFGSILKTSWSIAAVVLTTQK